MSNTTSPSGINPQLPETGFVRLKQIIGDPKAVPPIPPIIPVSKSTWWAGVQSGRFPKSVKLGPMTTAWDVNSIRKLIAHTAGGDPPTHYTIEIENRWVSVDERLPETGEWVLVSGGIAYLRGDEWWTITGELFPGKLIQWPVTHWQTLPEPPK